MVLYRDVFISRDLCNCVFQKEAAFRKMGQAFPADFLFDAGCNKSGTFDRYHAEAWTRKFSDCADKAERVWGRTKRRVAFYAG